MKVNEAPEKIILSADRDTEIIYDEWVIKDLTDSIKIEYTRTNAFITKAVNYLNCNLSGVVAIKDGNITQGLLRTKSEFIEDFKKFMERE